MVGNVLVTGPATEPVSAAEMLTHLRLNEGDAADSELNGYVAAARTTFEEATGLALINQTWRYALDRIPRSGEEPWWDGVREGSINELVSPARWIELPRAPLVSVTSFTTYNEADVAAVFTGFYTDTSARPGRVALRSGSVWPSATRGINGVEIVYVAGFGADASNVPADIKQAIKIIAANFFENREVQDFDQATAEVPLSARSIIKKRKLARL